jgi:hypothetical protein
MTFKVLKERCDQCLYGPNKIVREARRKQLLRDLARDDGHFICHKATIAGKQVACRGDWDQRTCGQLGRIAGRIGAVEFIEETALSS